MLFKKKTISVKGSRVVLHVMGEKNRQTKKIQQRKGDKPEIP